MTTFPQCNFSLKLPEILNQNHICNNWLSVSGISKWMHCEILISLPYWEQLIWKDFWYVEKAQIVYGFKIFYILSHWQTYETWLCHSFITNTSNKRREAETPDACLLYLILRYQSCSPVNWYMQIQKPWSTVYQIYRPFVLICTSIAQYD